jgi:hypothetical protein
VKRTALQRKTPLRSGRRPLPTFSPRRKAAAPARRAVVAAVRERDGNRCQAAGLFPVGCGGRLDVHELVRRSAWSQGYLDEGNCVCCCRSCHTYLSEHPAEAQAAGMHLASWERPK